MAATAVNRDLVFAVIALQNSFIDQADLIAAFQCWCADRNQALGEVLVARGTITREELGLIEVLIGKHLKKHGGDVHATLGALADTTVRDLISTVEEPDIQNSLTLLPPAAGGKTGETLMPTTREKRERYTLTQVHAHGGLGRVWLALDTDLNREVALKEILPDKSDDPGVKRRFLREAQVTGQLEHPSIIPVYELARRPEDDQPFYTMRFVRGQTLRQAIAEYHEKRAKGFADPLDRPRLLQAFVSVCQALAYAHSRGVIHRDLKPENVLLGGFGEVIVLDWGLAKTVDHPEEVRELGSVSLSDEAQAQATHAGEFLGTPAYMAPEQAAGRLDLIDSRTDIYGLGSILFEILTGRPPHQGQRVLDLIHQIANGATPRARSIDPSVPAALEAICAKAMAEARCDRYAGAHALAEDVQRWMADQPVSAWREPWTVRVRRWRAKNRTLVAAAAAALIVTLAAAGWSLKQAEVQAAREMARAAALVHAIQAAEIGKVPPLVEQLDGLRRWTDPGLRSLLSSLPDESPEKLRTALALVPVDARPLGYLLRRLLRANAEELLVIRDALKPFGNRVRPRLWALLGDRQTDPGERFRAAAALADFDPEDPRWQAHGKEVVDRLVKQDAQVLGFWTRAFSPARSALIKPLAATLRDHSRPEAERTIANNLIRAYADRPEDLVDLVQSADPELFDLLVGRLAHTPGQAIALLEQALDEPPPPQWNDPPLDPTWVTPDPKLTARIDQGQGLLAERFAFCQTMPLEVFVEVAEALRPSGYRPIRFRPYRATDVVQVAAVWARDGRPWHIVRGVTAGALVKEDQDWQQKGYRPVDVAGFVGAGPGEARDAVYAAVWVRSTGSDDAARLSVGMTETGFQQTNAGQRKLGFVLDTRSILLEPDGGLRTSAVWVKGEPSSSMPKSFLGSEVAYRFEEAGSRFQDDVGLSAATPPDLQQRYSAALYTLEQILKTDPSNLDALWQRAIYRFRLGQFEEARDDCTGLISLDSNVNEALVCRCRASVRLGKAKEARSDLASYINRNKLGARDDPQGLRVEALVACELGGGPAAFDRLERALALHPKHPEFLFHGACAYAEAARTVANRGYRDRAVHLLQEGVAHGYNRYLDLKRIHDEPDLESVRSHPGYRALMLPAGYDRELSVVLSESRPLESEEIYGLVPEAHRERCRELGLQGYRPAAIAVMAPRDNTLLVTASVWHRPLISPEARREAVERKGQVAAALVRLGQPTRVWPLLRGAPDSSLRTEIIHSLARFDSGFRACRSVVQQLRSERDSSTRRALILALGEFAMATLESERQALIPEFLSWYRNDPDPGVHASVDWLLRQKWGRARDLEQIDVELSGMAVPGDRDWYVNTEGQTLAIVRDPGVFLMGSPSNEAGHDYLQSQHLVRIDRTFAISTREVTEVQYRRLVGQSADSPDLGEETPRHVDWYEAVRYCNALSRQEQIPEDQWCYPKEIKEGMTIPADFVERTGYRLPTEAEWEYACRARTTTRRPHSDHDAWAERYVWCIETSGHDSWRIHPTGQLKPNDLGLFDILGNGCEWVQDSLDLIPPDPFGKARTDSGFGRIVDPIRPRVARGGAVDLNLTNARSAFRYPLPVTEKRAGFRPARTMKRDRAGS
jgi:serine/threonine protein kinase/formylglycine-generating enzyme required for sulfatase activity